MSSANMNDGKVAIPLLKTSLSISFINKRQNKLSLRYFLGGIR
jgi:hypothetical protein